MNGHEPPPRRPRPRRGASHCQANHLRLAHARAAVESALAGAAVDGFYGEVRLAVSFQDGVAQSVRLERSQMLR